jgi:hypothetical protein
MRIVMRLFDFINGSRQEFEFGDGSYRLRRFDPNTDILKKVTAGTGSPVFMRPTLALGGSLCGLLAFRST